MVQQLPVHPGELDAAARADYTRALRHDTSGGLQSLDELIGRAQFFNVRDGGGVVIARYALRVEQWAHGSEGVIAAAVGHLPGVDLTALFIPAIEKQLAGVDAV